MHDAVAMRVIESRADLNCDIDNPGELCGASMRQTRTTDVLHHEEWLAISFADVVDGNNVWMVQRGCRSCFAKQAGACVRSCGSSPGKYFDCYFSMKIKISGLIDNTHPSATQLAVEPVPFAEDGSNSNARLKILWENLCLLRINHW